MNAATELDRRILRAKLEYTVWRKSFDRAFQSWSRAPADLKSAMLMTGQQLQRAETWLVDFPDKISDAEKRFIMMSLQARPVNGPDPVDRVMQLLRMYSNVLILPAFALYVYVASTELPETLSKFLPGGLTHSALMTGLRLPVPGQLEQGLGAGRHFAEVQRREVLVTQPASSYPDSSEEPREDPRRPAREALREEWIPPQGRTDRGDNPQHTPTARPSQVRLAALERDAAPQAALEPPPITPDIQARILAEMAHRRWQLGEQRTAVLLAIEAVRGDDAGGNGGESDRRPTPGVLGATSFLLDRLARTAGVAAHPLNAGPVRPAQFCANTPTVVIASSPDILEVWRTDTPARKAQIADRPANLEGAAIDAACSRIALRGEDHSAEIFALSSGERLMTLYGHEATILSSAFSPDGATLLTASEDGSARLWDIKSGRVRAVLRGHDYAVSGASFSDDGALAVTASADRTVRIWDVASGRLLQVLAGHAGSINSAQLSRDGSRLLTASQDGTAGVWDVKSGSRLHLLKAKSAGILTASFNPDGQTFVTVTDGGEVVIWDAASGKPAATLAETGTPVRSTQFGAGGHVLVVHYWSGNVVAWDSRTGVKIARLNEPCQSVTAVAVASDGQHATGLVSDGTIMTWPIVSEPDAIARLARLQVSGCLSVEERKSLGLKTGQPGWCGAGDTSSVQ